MRLASSVCVAFAVLAGCAAPAGTGVPSAFARTAVAPRTAGAHSWMAPDAEKIDLLYVSDYATNDVYAYSYPQGRLRGVLSGVLSGFVYPSGLCADRAGDLFIPDSSNSTVLEYGHGSTKLKTTLLDLNEYPYTCAVDAASGTLSVIDLLSISGEGGVTIYAHKRPKIYFYPFLYFYYFGAYDGSGNLFMDASDDVPSLPFAFVELPKGSKSFEPVTLQQSFRAAGGSVAWDGKHLTVADPKLAVVYRFRITGSAGVKIGATHLKHAHSVAQYFIDGDRLVGANSGGSSVAFWKYPAGGVPTKTIRGFGEPFGVALSRAPR